MSDFDDIPAVGDALVGQCEEVEEDEEVDESASNESEVETDGVPSDGRYRFNGKNLYVTWSKSKIESKDEFYEKLLVKLPAGARVFGGRGLHQDGTPHYHAVISLLEKIHWRDAVSKLSIEGDTNAIRLEKPKPRQSPTGFLENTQAYCAKDNDTFGERISLGGAVAEQKKRKWRDASVREVTELREQNAELQRLLDKTEREKDLETTTSKNIRPDLTDLERVHEKLKSSHAALRSELRSNDGAGNTIEEYQGMIKELKKPKRQLKATNKSLVQEKNLRESRIISLINDLRRTFQLDLESCINEEDIEPHDAETQQEATTVAAASKASRKPGKPKKRARSSSPVAPPPAPSTGQEPTAAPRTAAIVADSTDIKEAKRQKRTHAKAPRPRKTHHDEPTQHPSEPDPMSKAPQVSSPSGPSQPPTHPSQQSIFH